MEEFELNTIETFELFQVDAELHHSSYHFHLHILSPWHGTIRKHHKI
jgi:hypothetical protein